MSLSFSDGTHPPAAAAAAPSDDEIKSFRHPCSSRSIAVSSRGRHRVTADDNQTGNYFSSRI